MKSMSLDSCHAYLAAQARNDNPHHSIRRPFVTISRQAGTDGTKVAKELATWLQRHALPGDPPWTVFDSNLIEKVLEDMHLPARLASFLPEDASFSVRNIVEECLGLHPSAYDVARKTTETMIHLANLGFCILVGRGGNFILGKFPQCVHVRLVGDFGQRIDRVARSRGLSLEQAIVVVANEDGARKRYVRSHFCHDNDDPIAYDLVLSMDHFTTASAASLIGQHLLELTEAAVAAGEDSFAMSVAKGNHRSHFNTAAEQAAYVTDPRPVS